MLGPSMAKALYDAVENNIPLDSSINIRRFLLRSQVLLLLKIGIIGHKHINIYISGPS
jgi:hypothetical protein